MDATLQLTLLGRAALAAFLGLAIGIERESRGKSAGERTFALLAFGAATATGLGSLVLGGAAASRVVQGILAGVGFLGAGVIFRRGRGDVRGLTTAAGAWAATGIGILSGAGAYLAAVLATALVILILELDRLPLLRRIHDQAARSVPPPTDAD
ncbi:MAG: MgtC/SapB family protein [Actinomycetota bacterium]